jgi:uncharacterized protein (TIGR02246 family)
LISRDSPADVKEEITKLQKDYDAAIVARDTKALEKLLDMAGKFVNAHGELLDRRDYIANTLVNTKEKIRTAETEIHSVRVLGNGAAIAIGTWKATGTDNGSALRYNMRVTAVWERRGGAWVLAAEHSTPIKDAK